jgi:hypothetical protein
MDLWQVVKSGRRQYDMTPISSLDASPGCRASESLPRICCTCIVSLLERGVLLGGSVDEESEFRIPMNMPLGRRGGGFHFVQLPPRHWAPTPGDRDLRVAKSIHSIANQLMILVSGPKVVGTEHG